MPTFTGFWEASGPEIETEVATTISYWPIPRLLDALRARLESARPGTHIVVDLISWDGAEDPVDPHKVLLLNEDELDALWRQFATTGEGIDPGVRLRLIEKIQTLVEA